MKFPDRYSRQTLFAPLGEAGHNLIAKSSATLIGCGALGSTIANALVRAGVKSLTLIDSDHLEWSNLQRQTLYDESQVEAGTNKAVAARDRLQRINSEVEVIAVEARVTADNIAQLLKSPDLVMDGSDNFPTRYMLNDYCVRENIPWIYGGCAASYGVAMPIVPGQTPCLRCVFIDPPPPEQAATADTVGILGPIAHLVASLQSGEALKILSRNLESVKPVLYTADLWEGSLNSVNLPPPEENCPCCGLRHFDFLEGVS